MMVKKQIFATFFYNLDYLLVTTYVYWPKTVYT